MSSEEDEHTNPVVPEDDDDDDQNSSISSDLQDEYGELLRFAVVTLKPETPNRTHMQLLSTSHLSAEGRTSQRKDDRKSQHLADATGPKDQAQSRQSVISKASSMAIELSKHSRHSCAEETSLRPSSKASMTPDAFSDRLLTVPETSGPDSPNPPGSAVAEMFLTENISKMENILDTWSNNLKSNVLVELRKWKLAFKEQHMLELRKEREKSTAQTAALRSELDSLKELLQTYETSSQRKDEVIKNLSSVLDRQKEKLEKMRTFTQWRLKHTEAKEEALANQAAQQHYNMQLKKKVWSGWHSLVQKHWKVKVEQACQARAEEVCTRLSADYEAKLAEHCEAIEKAQAEMQRLRVERERYEESMKKAFMRGVCALNIEALGIFQNTDGHSDRTPVFDQQGDLPPHEEPWSSSGAQFQPYPATVAEYSPAHFDRVDHPLSEGNSGAPAPRTEVPFPHTGPHINFPLGSTASSHKPVGGRGITTEPQSKPTKTITARVTARTAVGKTSRHNLQVMGVTPPNSSVMVERHYAAPQGRSSSAGRGSSRVHTTTCNAHSIKVVD